MKVAAMFGDRKAGVVDKPDPKSAGNYVVVKVHVVPMCTEYHHFDRGGEGESFGHEAVGEVVDVAQDGEAKIGDRVVVQPQDPCGQCYLCLDGDYIHCHTRRRIGKDSIPEGGRGRYAQYTVQQDWLLSPVPDELSYEHAGMAVCGLGPTFGAMEAMSVGPYDTVLVTGLGPVGLGGVINGVFRGARVIGVESHPFRANLAKELGADAVVNPKDEDALEQIRDLTDGEGVDKAVDCSGASPAHRLMIDALKRRGQAGFIGQGGEFPLGCSSDMISKGIILRGCWHYNLGLYPNLARTIAKVGDQLDKFITHRFPLTQVQDAWETQATGNCGKVILYPWQ
ncbi:zinc-binding dehydrogenase [Candidatus Poribacteria bacterium]|nr:zinc-binding dehydrogenase [Candidatus Poribacteria bacterium]MBT5532436.1 zinc-binding dehydrogenase [Candidatus Poribacteria bacterium]MBT5713075.1 zinc-binding dehydrogenase [Candidatus Poribacteria bacterium]MBT7101601.1 zinc-binding dehydrogenase [Candidatus Poribacteria bacterium]MBT7806461.1 zinc-binding dehydrogenase [Candidatus Poribacteria bacterium]